MDISVEELYMLLGVKEAQLYKLQQENAKLKEIIDNILPAKTDEK